MNKNNVRLTVATVVEQHKRFLMVRELDDGKEVINQPAGHWEPGESLQQAAIRETLEETGWDVQLDALIGVFMSRAPNEQYYCRVAFAASTVRHHANKSLDPDILQTEWLSRDDLMAEHDKMRSQLVLHTLDAYLVGQRFDLSAVGALIQTQ